MNKKIIVLSIIGFMSLLCCIFTTKTCVPASKPIISTYLGRGKLEYRSYTEYCKDRSYQKNIYHTSLEKANAYQGHVLVLYTNYVFGDTLELIDMIISRFVILFYTVIISVCYLMTYLQPRIRYPFHKK